METTIPLSQLLAEYRDRTGFQDTVEPIDGQYKSFHEGAYCHYGRDFQPSCGQDATHLVEASPYCDHHTEEYLLAVLKPLRELDELIEEIRANGFKVTVIDAKKTLGLSACQSKPLCNFHAQFIIEGEEYCRQHFERHLRQLLDKPVN